MDSSPDLSLKLRRGSNDSRDSYYMDFAQGIDSDIEEVATVATAPPGNIEVASDSSDSQAAAVVLPPATMAVETTQEEEEEEGEAEAVDIEVEANDLDIDEKEQPELAIDDYDEPLPPSPPPPPLLESILPMPTIPSMPPGPLNSSAITSLTDTSTTDEEDLSQITPLPMPILPPLKTDILQMLPSQIPLDDEG